MNSNFHAAIYAFTMTLITGYLVSAAGGDPRDDAETLRVDNEALTLPRGILAILATALLTCCIALNILWR